MTPEELAEVERQFARKKPHERFFQPVPAMTAFGMTSPVMTPFGMVLPDEDIDSELAEEQEESGA